MSDNAIANIHYFAFGLDDPNENSVDSSRLPTVETGCGQVTLSYLRPIANDWGIEVRTITSTNLIEWFLPSALGPEYKPVSEIVTPVDSNYESVTQAFTVIDSKRFYTVEVMTTADR